MKSDQVFEEIHDRRRHKPAIPALAVYCVTLFSEDRDEFKEELRQVSDEWPLVPWILRTHGLFRDPNAVMNDVTFILSDVRCEIADIAEYARQREGVDLVVLARDELRLAITSSPILLPQWFPLTPGEMVTAQIDDLTWSVNVAVSDEVVALSELQRILYELDKVMVDLIRRSLETDHNKVNALWNGIQDGDEDEIGMALGSIEERLEDVANPTSFRPRARRNSTMVGRLWFSANGSSPDQLPKLAKALASALRVNGLDLARSEASLVGVLGRPTNPISDRRTRWCFHLLVTLRAACQLVTAAAHADDYPRFPDVLLRATSRDLRRFLDGAIQILKGLPPPDSA